MDKEKHRQQVAVLKEQNKISEQRIAYLKDMERKTQRNNITNGKRRKIKPSSKNNFGFAVQPERKQKASKMQKKKSKYEGNWRRNKDWR